MIRRWKRIVALSVLGVSVALMGCETVGFKKAPPGQVKKVTGEQSAGKKK